jgi:hypothetical protein
MYWFCFVLHTEIWGSGVVLQGHIASIVQKGLNRFGITSFISRLGNLTKRGSAESFVARASARNNYDCAQHRRVATKSPSDQSPQAAAVNPYHSFHPTGQNSSGFAEQ